jgi:group I intron endonuclease
MAYSGTVGQTVWHIYILTNSINGKQYVGITNSLRKRWNKHKNASGSAPALHAAIKKYGVDVFIFTHFLDAFDSESAKKIEVMLIKEHNTKSPFGYNLTSGGDGFLEPCDELKKKLSNSHKGKTQSEETKKKRSESLKKAYFEGRHSGVKNKTWKWSEDSRKEFSDLKKGKNNPMYGNSLSKEHIEKIRLSSIGRKDPKEVVERKIVAQRLRRELEKAKANGEVQ